LKQLGSLRKLSVSFLLIFTSVTSSGIDRYSLSAGAGEAGAGYVCVMKKGFWASFSNQALLAGNNSFSFGINYDNRFNINELGTRTAGMIIPSGRASLGVIYSNFGYADFRRDMTGVACGLKLSERLSTGAQVDYFAELAPGEYEDTHIITGEAGVVYSASENTTIGIHIFNPVPNSVRKNTMPLTLRTGAGTMLNKFLFVGAEAEMSSEKSIILRMGFEYEAAKEFFLRSGFCTDYNSFSFGFGYRIKFVKIDLAFATHEKLGITSSVSLIFIIR